AFVLSRLPKRAIEDYERALELKPAEEKAHLALAGVLMSEAQFTPALEHFLTYLRQHPDDPMARFGEAHCRVSLRHSDAARATLDQLLAKPPDHAAAMLVRAKLELANGSAAQALDWLKRAEAVAPNETDITYAIQQTYQQLGKPDEARKY